MANFKSRVDTISFLIRSKPIMTLSTGNLVIGEFNDVIKCNSIKEKPRRFILMVLHSTRAFDSTLRWKLDSTGSRGTAVSIGQYLDRFEAIRKISGLEKVSYKTDIANVRNEYMHIAGRYPSNEQQIFALLSNMDACLARVLI